MGALSILGLTQQKGILCLSKSWAAGVDIIVVSLSSPRAESARAFTGRRNSYSGRGEDFFSCQPIFLTETAVTPERKVEKWFPRWEINRHAEG